MDAVGCFQLRSCKIMGIESAEEAGLQPTRPLLSDGSNNSTATSSSSSDSSITSVLVFSTFVAVCGSFSYGCAYSLFGSIMTIGGMMGAILSGKIADLTGRRRVTISTMWLSQIFCTTGWLAISFAKDAMWLDIGRLSIGFGVGLISFVVPVYIAEIAPKHYRGRFTTANQFMVSCGFGLMYFIGNVISWRYLSLMAAVPCLIQVVGLFFIPESPRWLNAIEIFQDIRQATTSELFQRKYAYPIIVGVGLMVLQQFGGSSGISYYVTTIFTRANFSVSIGTTGLAIIEDLECMKEITPILVFVVMLGFASVFAMGMAGIPWVLMSEIFPVNIKASAGSMVTLTNWFCSWIVTYAFNFMIEWSTAGTFFIFAGVYACTVIFIWKLVPETKGKTLEEIQASITSFPQQVC
ncbi:hypothetical protein Tsubulata_019548 [Turnera subulata]|uniref:Major facilitator superfamily (MFS) profile domain-containing protein n=1 Tax=Turnera subulata TaxID=218843 RepID=A0A9Q0EYT6_9ROSI|nr:hypothetical protein Tsubulata_019548 [Turnera subulata]